MANEKIMYEGKPLTLPIGRASFPELDKPIHPPGADGKPDLSKEPKYQLTVYIPDSAKLQEALKRQEEFAVKAFKAKASKVRRAIVKMDETVSGYQEWMGSNTYRVRANSSQDKKPVVYDENLAAAVPGKVYAGCFVRATVSLATHNFQGNAGVKAYLSSVQFVADGEPLAGSRDDGSQYTEGVDADELAEALKLNKPNASKESSQVDDSF